MREAIGQQILQMLGTETLKPQSLLDSPDLCLR
jgi:hypothetical protein